jgi:undecaprenyl-diphosphatase
MIPLRQALGELDALDQAVYGVIAATPTPTLDAVFRRLSNTANKSRLWIGIAAPMTVSRHTRPAAIDGLAAIAATSATVNLGVKPLLGRRRPDRASAKVVLGRQVTMPRSTSFPSGHAASAVAFATAVGNAYPPLSLPLHILAASVCYSRVHTGVHYPGDVIAGSLIGSVVGGLAGHATHAVRARRAARTKGA